MTYIADRQQEDGQRLGWRTLIFITLVTFRNQCDLYMLRVAYHEYHISTFNKNR